MFYSTSYWVDIAHLASDTPRPMRVFNKECVPTILDSGLVHLESKRKLNKIVTLDSDAGWIGQAAPKKQKLLVCLSIYTTHLCNS